MMVTVVSALLPATIPTGSTPKESFTDSSSSSIKSSGAVNLNVFWVSPDTNTTLDGTPE